MRFDRQCGIWCFTLLAAWWAGALRGAELPALRISDNHRCLVTEDGKPFFWLGDTAWSLFEKLNREDADLYLEHRAGNGFTVIQAVLIFEGGVEPNAYGHPQLSKDARGRWDPSQPNEEYFRHVDYIVTKAESLGLYIGMIPVWAGSNVRQDRGLFNLENITEGLQAAEPGIPRLTAADVRRFAYCGVFAGAAGHTYGCNEIYQFWTEATKPHARWGAEIPWKQALDLPGARQMQNRVRSRFTPKAILPPAPAWVRATGTRPVGRGTDMGAYEGQH